MSWRICTLIAVTITLIPMLLVLSGCRSSVPADSDATSQPAPVMTVTGAKVIVKPMHTEERLLGETVAMRHLTMRAPAAGRVLGLNLQTGDRVHRGEIVAHVLSREVEAAENGLAIAQQIDPANAAHLAASVNRYSHGEGVAVTAPEDALVAQRMVTSGQMVADLDPLVDLIDPRSIAVNVTVPAAALATLHPGMPARVTSPIHPGEVYPAYVVAIAPSFNQGGATSSARVEFTGANRILESGAPAEVRITSADVPDALVIPLSALFQDATNDSYYVFIASADGRAHRIPVTIGLRDGSGVQVTTGLAAGQVVITSGGYALSDGLNVNVAIDGQLMRSNSLLAVCAVLALSILGVILGRSLPSAVFPQVQFNRAIILADSGDLPSAQMLVAVTRPLEEAAYGVMNVSLVSSTTTRGGSELDVTFNEDTDPVASFQLLNSAINEVRARLPAGTTVQSRLLTAGTFPVLDISLSSHDRGVPELTDIAQYDLVPSLHRIAGVYRVDTVGAKYREYDIWLDPAKLLQHNLAPDDVVNGLANANVIESAGRVMDLHRMMLTVVTANLHDADALAALPIANVAGQPIAVRDIGRVELGVTEDYIRTASENGRSLLVTVSQQPGGNTVAIADEAHALIRQFQARYPDVTFSFSYNQAALVSEAFTSVRDAIVLGLLLAVAVVLIFTRSILSAIVAAIVVPCTIAITCVIMKIAGASFNMMTLGGLAAGIGLFIDDAIVVIEAIHRSRASGESVTTAVRALVRPLIASTATVVIVFAPLVFLSGVTGVFFRALALTLGGGLAVSLILALYFNPTIEVMVERFRRPSGLKDACRTSSKAPTDYSCGPSRVGQSCPWPRLLPRSASPSFSIVRPAPTTCPSSTKAPSRWITSCRRKAL